jgi:hypothetical protein
MNAAVHPKYLVKIYQTTRRHISEDSSVLGFFVVSYKLISEKLIWKYEWLQLSWRILKYNASTYC